MRGAPYVICAPSNALCLLVKAKSGSVAGHQLGALAPHIDIDTADTAGQLSGVKCYTPERLTVIRVEKVEGFVDQEGWSIVKVL